MRSGAAEWPWNSGFRARRFVSVRSNERVVLKAAAIIRVITIDREYCSGAAAIAKRVAVEAAKASSEEAERTVTGARTPRGPSGRGITLRRDASSTMTPGATGEDFRGYLWPVVRRARFEYWRRYGRPLQLAAARERNGQLRQGCATNSGEDRVRPGTGPSAPVAPGDVRGTEGEGEIGR